MNAIIRIDEVNESGESKIKKNKGPSQPIPFEYSANQ